MTFFDPKEFVMDEPIRVTLPPVLMTAIEVLANSDMEASQKYSAIVLMTYGHALFDAADAQIRAAIPEEQWHAICGLMTTFGTDAIDQVNWGLSWMNQGPSAFKAVPV